MSMKNVCKLALQELAERIEHPRVNVMMSLVTFFLESGLGTFTFTTLASGHTNPEKHTCNILGREFA